MSRVVHSTRSTTYVVFVRVTCHPDLSSVSLPGFYLDLTADKNTRMGPERSAEQVFGRANLRVQLKDHTKRAFIAQDLESVECHGCTDSGDKSLDQIEDDGSDSHDDIMPCFFFFFFFLLSFLLLAVDGALTFCFLPSLAILFTMVRWYICLLPLLAF